MVASAQTFEKVMGIVAEVLEADTQDLGEETTLEELSADSLDVLEIVTAIEEEFEVSLPDEGLEDIQTIGDAAAFVEEALE